MKSPHASDYLISLPEVGEFRFSQETYADRIAIRAHYLGLVKDHKDTDTYLSTYAGLIAEFQQLCVSCPPDWQNLAAQVITDERETQLFELVRQLRQLQQSFRNSAAQGGQAQG